MKSLKFHILALLFLTLAGTFAAPLLADEAPYDRGLAAYNAGDYTTAYELILPLAEHDHPAALNLLGMMYETGKGVREDPGRAVEYYRRGAKLGDIYAQFNLAVSYNTGIGVPMNYRAAVKWYRKAAEQGASFAQYSLATMYEDGYGVEKNLQQAAYWYLKAAENGSVQAQNNLAWMYGKGLGVERDLITAYAWLDLAVAQGLDSARDRRRYVAGKLTKEEFEKARVLAQEYRKQYIK